jgi:hypothetical protein
MLRKIYGFKRGAVRGQLWILHRKKLHDSCRAHSIVKFIDYLVILIGWVMQHQKVR